MLICRTLAEVRDAIEAWRRDGHTVALVPTMGNLHQGHVALLQEASRWADKVTASIFVNALQFDRQEDFDTYPRTENSDFECLRQCGTALVFVPDNDEMYPLGIDDVRQDDMNLGDIAQDLCGTHRPGHFQGVVRAVKRLFDIFMPDVAVFGKKDYQQQYLIRQAVKSFGFDLRIVSVPTVRNEEGLALSSRNAHLNTAQKNVAPFLYRILTGVAESLRSGARDFDSLIRQAQVRLEQVGFRVDYFEIRTIDLTQPTAEDTEFVVLAAVWLGQTRLIDNVSVESRQE